MIDNNFLQNNKQQLIQIYINERLRSQNQLGSLFIDFSKNDNADVYYLTLSDMPENIRKKFLELENLNQKNTIFFYIFDSNVSNIVEIVI
tara:strand:- start:64 stop:333 length:270 start_codon:yes stop_codon:yes gene_type:complete